jgi:catechol 2,3-dioxygenase-like lactoylglutathione lyase family enzyme
LANSFGKDILIQSPDPAAAAAFYVERLGFTITDPNPRMMELQGENINLYIEPGPALGPVLEVTVADVAEARHRLVAHGGCTVVKDEPEFPRTYVSDPFGLIYNLTT